MCTSWQTITNWTNLFPASSPEMTAPSTMVNEPMPGKTNDFKISVPVAVAFMRQTLEFSRALCPWSPHNLTLEKWIWKLHSHQAHSKSHYRQNILGTRDLHYIPQLPVIFFALIGSLTRRFRRRRWSCHFYSIRFGKNTQSTFVLVHRVNL